MMTMIKKTALAGFIALWVGAPGLASASAGDLRNAMDSLTKPFANVQTQKPFRYSSEIREGIGLGSGRITIPNSGSYGARNLFSLQEPDLKVGCAGISWHLGAVSWVSLDEIKQMVENAIPAAALFAAEMVLGAISGDILSTVRNVMSRIQEANRMLSNSCELGRNFAQGLWNTVNNEANAARCDSVMAESGQSKDRMSARRRECANSRNLQTMMKEWITNKPSNPERARNAEKEQDQTCKAWGNKVWCGLVAGGFVQTPEKLPVGDASREYDQAIGEQVNSMHSYVLGEMVLSMTGTVVGIPDQPAEQAGEQTEPQPLTVPPVMPSSADAGFVFFDMIMCGSEIMNGRKPPLFNDNDISIPPDIVSKIERQVQKVCDKMVRTPVTVSNPGSADDPEEAESANVRERPNASEQTVIACLPEGFTYDPSTRVLAPAYKDGTDYRSMVRCMNPQAIPIEVWAEAKHVKSMLSGGVLWDVSTLMYAAIIAIRNGSPIPQRAIALIERAPFPLYRYLNLASIYPGAEYWFSDAVSMEIGAMIAQEIINQIVLRSFREGAPANGIDGALVAETVKLMSAFTQAAAERVDTLAFNESRAMEFAKKVDLLEKTVIRSIYQRNLLGNYAVSMELGRAVGGGGSPPLP